MYMSGPKKSYCS